jgi:hypothetical protein
MGTSGAPAHLVVGYGGISQPRRASHRNRDPTAAGDNGRTRRPGAASQRAGPGWLREADAMTKTISALVLAAIVAAMSATAALAAPKERGAERGLSHACAHPVAALKNPNCGWA